MAETQADEAGVQTYISSYPSETQEALTRIKAIVERVAPEAVPTMRYKIPTYVLNGNLISFAAYKTHLGLYPRPTGDEAFREEIAPYATQKSTMRFPLDKPIPYDLIERALMFRLAEHTAAQAARQARRAGKKKSG